LTGTVKEFGEKRSAKVTVIGYLFCKALTFSSDNNCDFVILTQANHIAAVIRQCIFRCLSENALSSHTCSYCIIGLHQIQCAITVKTRKKATFWRGQLCTAHAHKLLFPSFWSKFWHRY